MSEPAARRGLGNAGEALAARWLEARGYRIVARNWRCQWGELDLIASQGSTLVFVEVKTRRGAQLGAPEEAITARKRAHLRDSAAAYLAAQDDTDVLHQPRDYRIDVVAVQLSPAGKLIEIRHHPDAVGEDA